MLFDHQGTKAQSEIDNFLLTSYTSIYFPFLANHFGYSFSINFCPQLPYQA